MNKFILTHRPPFLSLSLSLTGEGERARKRKNKKKVAGRANFFMIRDGKEISLIMRLHTKKNGDKEDQCWFILLSFV